MIAFIQYIVQGNHPHIYGGYYNPANCTQLAFDFSSAAWKISSDDKYATHNRTSAGRVTFYREIIQS